MAKYLQKFLFRSQNHFQMIQELKILFLRLFLYINDHDSNLFIFKVYTLKRRKVLRLEITSGTFILI